MLEIDIEKVRFIISKAREYEAQEDAIEGAYEGSVEDDDYGELESGGAEGAAFDEIKSWIDSLNWDDQCQIVALTWVGRGDFTKDEWDEALRIANQEHNERTAEYLLGMPMLGDYLEEGLSQLGLDDEAAYAAEP